MAYQELLLSGYTIYVALYLFLGRGNLLCVNSLGRGILQGQEVFTHKSESSKFFKEGMGELPFKDRVRLGSGGICL